MLLSIESSCDESACTLFRCEDITPSETIQSVMHDELISSQVKLHELYGGVVPELASREHIKNIPLLVEHLLSKNKLSFRDISKIAVTSGPGLKGCLLVGVSYAKGLATGLSVPLYGINHLEGHILSPFCETPIQNIPDLLPALCLLVSGGHTQLIKIHTIGSYEILATTSDDAAGEAFDKIGTLLGFSYPAGRAVSEAAMHGSPIHPLPLPVQDSVHSFSFSGLKTAAFTYVKKQNFINSVREEKDRFISDFSASLEAIIVRSLVSKTTYFLSNGSYRSLLLCGGVAANRYLRSEIESCAAQYTIPCLIPRPFLCTDNATMIGAVAILKYILNGLNPSNENLQVRARWGLSHE